MRVCVRACVGEGCVCVWRVGGGYVRACVRACAKSASGTLHHLNSILFLEGGVGGEAEGAMQEWPSPLCRRN